MDTSANHNKLLYETCRLRRRFSIGVRTKCELQSRTATRKFAAEERLSTRRSVDEEINAKEETVNKKVSWRGGAEATCCKENRRTRSLPITNFSLTAPFNSPEQVNAIFLYCPKPKRRNRIHVFIDFTLVDRHKKDRSDALSFYSSHFRYVGFNVFHYKTVFCVI